MMGRKEIPDGPTQGTCIPDVLLDQLLAGADPKRAFDADGLLDDLKKALAERALNAEMDHHLASDETSNSRNGMPQDGDD
jgi:transposase-like protein